MKNALSGSKVSAICRLYCRRLHPRSVVIHVFGVRAVGQYVDILFSRPLAHLDVKLGLAVKTAVRGIAYVDAVFLWNRSVKLMGPGRAGPYMHLIPAYGVVMAIAVLDETFHLYHVIGICLIGIGIYYSTILRHKTEAS